MSDFFESLKTIEKVFLIIAVLGGGLFAARLILFFLGMGHHDADAGSDFDGDADVGGGDVHDVYSDSQDHHADSESSFRFISLQSITAFFMMFGLVGLALSKQSGWSETFSILGAMAAGIFSVWIIGKILKVMKKLQSEGTLDIRNAIGAEGTVYLTIPASGQGVVQITVQDCLRELTAVSRDKSEIKTGERVIVEEIAGGNILVVRKV